MKSLSRVDPAQAFERCYCVNLERRPDRWRRFAEGLPPDWPFPQPERVEAIDGRRVKHPDYWSSGRGAWGCYRSHLRIIEQCLNEGVRSVLILEDDALFPPDFVGRVTAWLRDVPPDWQMLYLGGQHLFAQKHPPRRLHTEKDLWQPYNVNRTHAFALQGEMLTIVYQHLLRRDWHARNHVDHHLGRLHQQRRHRIYCPGEWLVGQAGMLSNISGRTPSDRMWRAAHEIASEQRASLPAPSLLAIVGLHSSGSSALAQALWRLGLWFGDASQLTGYWGKMSPVRGGEHRELREILESASPLGATAHARPRRWVWRRLRNFIAARTSEAADRGTLAVIKYPQLCQAGRQLRSIAGDGLRVIVCDRPIEESIKSLTRRLGSGSRFAHAQIAAHQRWLAEGRDALASQIPSQVLRVRYDDLLRNPCGQLERVARWLEITPTRTQFDAAADAIKPKPPNRAGQG